MKIKCPECGSEEITLESSKQRLQAPYGSLEIFKEEFFECDDCGHEASDDSEGSRYKALYQESTANSIPAILNFLDENGFSMIATERVLELPFRTLSRWKSELKVSAAGLALLRLLATYPWLLKVADSGYDKQFAENTVMIEGAEIFNAKLHQNDIDWQFQVENPDDCSVRFSKNKPNNYLSTGNQILTEVL